jgi:hypothetical protein
MGLCAAPHPITSSCPEGQKAARLCARGIGPAMAESAFVVQVLPATHSQNTVSNACAYVNRELSGTASRIC